MLVSPTIDPNALSYDKLVLPTLSQLGKGVVGVIKAVSNIGVLPIDTIKNRKSICNTCEFNNKNGIYSQCIKCACLISLKTKLTKETCPMNKW